MFSTITSLFKQVLEGNDLSTSANANPNLAIACLLREVSGADHDVHETEQQAKLHLMQILTQLSSEECQQLLSEAEEKVKLSASLYDFTSQLRELSQEQRFDLIKAMWDVAHADGIIDPLEDSVIRKAAELLYVDHGTFIRAKLTSSESR